MSPSTSARRHTGSAFRLRSALALAVAAWALPGLASPVLQQLLITTDPGAAASQPGLSITGLPEIDSAALRQLLGLQLGRPLSPQAVQAMVTEVNRRLAAAGQPFSVASVPDQDVSRGQLRIVVTRGRLAALRITGAADADAISRQFDAMRGDAPIDAAALDATLAWIDRALPGRQSEARFSPGAQPGAVALDLQVHEPDRLALSAGADNTGSPVTGTRRVSAGLTISRLLGSSDQASLRVSGDPSFGHARSWQASYQVGLPWRHVLSLSANSGSIHGRMPEPLDLRGSSSGQSLRYEIPLRLTGPWTDSLSLGFDHKRSDNNLLFSDTPVTQTVTDIGQFSASYSAERPDALGRTRVTATLTVSPGGLIGHNDDAAFEATRAGAKARYQVLQVQLERGTQLGALHWQSQLTLQQANANLLGSEQLNGGGVSSVRGFAEGAGYGDSGWLWRNELRAPSWQGPAGLVLTPAMLLDAAQLRVHTALPGEPARRHLASAGLGLTASGPGKLSLSLQWAQRIKSGVPSQPQHGSRLHVSLQWAGF